MATTARRRDGITADDPAARILHDLRAPLTVIRGLCETLDSGRLDGRIRHALRAIDGEVTRLARGLDALQGRDADPDRPVDLARVAASAAERFRWAASERDVRLSVRAGRPAWILGDPHAIARVLDNLLANALRHCAAGGRVAVGVRPRGASVHLTVRDDGPGIPPDDREIIFAAGCRGSEPRGPGQGLGLAIARDIATAHGGTLTVDLIGRGACFRLVLPRIPDEGGSCTAA
jgi:two-component system heavy metal sensor histidine kinase CusS